jgi:hypothetical protein
MAAPKEYRRYSARCLQEARTSEDYRLKAFLVEMAQSWQRLAEQATTVKGAQACSGSEPDRGD